MSTATFSNVLVLGAGPAGITAGLGLGSQGLVLEQSREAGGLSCTIEFEGGVFDIGGHSLHTPHPEVRELAQQTISLFEQQRDARCYSHGELIAYPFQKHFRSLGLQQVVEECAAGLSEVAVRDGGKPANFAEFLHTRFGSGICRHFMLPYNQKLWGRDLTRLAADWVGERVAAPEGVAEKFDEAGGKRKPLQAETRVAYPARGGFGALMTALAEKLPALRCEERVVSVDTQAREVLTALGNRYRYARLVSTLPLPDLLRLCASAPTEVASAAARLEYLSLKVVMLVMDHPVDTNIQRIYCADDTVPAHKVAFNHNSSDYLRALPRHGIMAEVSCANGKLPTDAELCEWTLQGLNKMGVLSKPGRLVAQRVVDVKYAYPVPTHDRDGLVTRIRSWLLSQGIETVGRFGEWAYINSDEAMHRGLALGRRLGAGQD